MIQVALCEQALVKANRKPIENHQSKTLLLFKTFTLEFEFDRYLEHMFSYQRMQSGLPMFLVGEIGTFEIFFKTDCLEKPDFSYFSNYKQKWSIFGQNMIISSHFLITNQLYLDSGLFIKLKT